MADALPAFEPSFRTGLLAALEEGVPDFEHSVPSSVLADVLDVAIGFVMGLIADNANDSPEVLALRLRLSEVQRQQAEGEVRRIGARMNTIKQAFYDAFPEERDGR